MTSPRKDGDSNAISLGLLGLMAFLFIAAISCSRQDNGASRSSSSDNYVSNLEGPVEANAPLPLDPSAIDRGGAQLRLVASLNLPGSRQIFSLNCYDALAKSFDWHQLDRCGGFDAMVVRWADQGAGLTEDELKHFEPEVAAARYLSTATSNGLAASDADVRWANLQAVVSRLPLPRIVSSGDDAANPDADSNLDSSDPGASESDTSEDPLAPADGTPQ